MKQIYILGVELSIALVELWIRLAIWCSSLVFELSYTPGVNRLRLRLFAMLSSSVLGRQSWFIFFQFFWRMLFGFVKRTIWKMVVIRKLFEWWLILLRSLLMMLFDKKVIEYIKSIVNLPFSFLYMIIPGERRRLSLCVLLRMRNSLKLRLDCVSGPPYTKKMGSELWWKSCPIFF